MATRCISSNCLQAVSSFLRILQQKLVIETIANAFIEVGYGLEGALSDIASKRIISDTIVPRFKQGDYFSGIDAGVAQIIRVVDGEALPGPASQRTQGPDDLRQMFPFLLIVVLVVSLTRELVMMGTD